MTPPLTPEEMAAIKARWIEPSPLGIAWPEQVAHARIDIPRLIEDLKRAQDEIERLENERWADALRTDVDCG